jgi:transmembrane 9 superfamily protein 3
MSRIPFCLGEDKKLRRTETLAESLAQHDMIDSQMKIRFLEDVSHKPLCSLKFSPEDVNRLADAVWRNFWVEMTVDGLPIWGYLGIAGGEAPDDVQTDHTNTDVFLYTHHNFVLSHNQDKIVQVQYAPEHPVLVYDAENAVIATHEATFTYSITWVATDLPFAKRFNTYLESNFFENSIHWFSILNSFVMVVFMISLVAVIMAKMLSNDYKNIADFDELENFEASLSEVTGWK